MKRPLWMNDAMECAGCFLLLCIICVTPGFILGFWIKIARWLVDGEW